MTGGLGCICRREKLAKDSAASINEDLDQETVIMLAGTGGIDGKLLLCADRDVAARLLRSVDGYGLDSKRRCAVGTCACNKSNLTGLT
jgi:hypothetical protein